jgi:hypothetical protein
MALAFMERGGDGTRKSNIHFLLPTSQFPHYFSGFRVEK